jgi:NAD(P)-dependent dehydrogenase (short-subunit alcohol dehydrogenase family)
MILQDKVSLVTRGTAGIGQATALAKLNEVIAFGAAGAKVVFSGRHDAEGEKTAKLIRETGAECLYVHSDALNEEEIKALVQKTVVTYERLDCAFNNVGNEGLLKPLHEQSIEEFDKLMEINVRGLFLRMGYEIQQMLSQKSGVIVNNSSLAGLFGLPGGSPYSASKHAVMGLTRSAALDYAKQGIRINAVNPGNIATEALNRVFEKLGVTADAVTAMVPMGRISQAEKVAQVVVFLCSDAASYITEQSLVIDGGYTAN